MASNGVVVIYTGDRPPTTDKATLSAYLKRVAAAAWEDVKTTNASTAGKGLKFGAGVVAASTIARTTETLTPLAWALKRFGALPMEFTKSGTIQVFEFTTAQRALQMAKAAGIKFVLVTVAFEGGVLVGSVINQVLSTETKDAIGGTIDEIVNHEGWKDLWRHPFGAGMW